MVNRILSMAVIRGNKETKQSHSGKESFKTGLYHYSITLSSRVQRHPNNTKVKDD